MKSTVDHSKHRKAASKVSAPSSTPSFFNRVTSLFSSTSNSSSTEREAPVAPPPPPRLPRAAAAASKKKYGFAQSNLFHTDTTSENLYRLKNISAEQMRSSSPPRETERPPPLALQPAVSVVLEADDMDVDEMEKKPDDDKKE